MNYAQDGFQGPTAVICGSFRRDPRSLAAAVRDLQGSGCLVLSPQDTEFVREVDGFVLSRSDVGRTPSEIEWSHLRAMEAADFVWLHAPAGYVGSSAAMELGYARASGLRVFAAEAPTDITLRDGVRVVSEPSEALKCVQGEKADAPSRSLPALQSYYARVSRHRGWDSETADDTISRLRGEIQELEEALLDANRPQPVFEELADVQLYLVHLANILNADLGREVQAKERMNSARFDPATVPG
jgi:NTP pyrophosphatase (non-canonical NTP hydrolase)